MINTVHIRHYAVGCLHRLRGRSRWRHFLDADLPNLLPLLPQSYTLPHRPWVALRPSIARAIPIISPASPHQGCARRRSCELVEQRCHLRRQQFAPTHRHQD